MVNWFFLTSTIVLSISSATAAGVRPGQIKNLVTFGDSFTDTFWIANGGQNQWPTYATRYSKTTLYPYARSGGTCSNELTPRPFPSVFESQLPTYYDAVKTREIKVRPDETLYSLWIGTNDVGANALLTESKSNIVEVSDCMINWVKVLYQKGARNFLFQNMVPLETIPMYSPNAYLSKYWTADRNATQWSNFIKELVVSNNELTKLKLEALAPKLPGAHIALFDSHSLFADMYAHPAHYLNGTAPLNVTGAANACVYEVGEDGGSPGRCTTAVGLAKDSFLWYDELHPSEQASRVVAQQVAQVIQGRSNKWTRWLS